MAMVEAERRRAEVEAARAGLNLAASVVTAAVAATAVVPGKGNVQSGLADRLRALKIHGTYTLPAGSKYSSIYAVANRLGIKVMAHKLADGSILLRRVA